MTDRITRVPNCITLVPEMQSIVREAARPPAPGESVKSQINRAARRLGLSPRRAETLWYGRPGQILAEEADRLRAWRRRWAAEQRARLAAEMAALDGVEAQLRLDLMREEQRGGIE